MWRQQIRQPQPPLGKFEIEQGFAIEQQQIERDEAHRHEHRCKKIDLLTPQALLEFGKRDRASVTPADDFPVENEVTGNLTQRRGQLRKFSNTIERARIHLDSFAALVNLSANAVEFFFDKRSIGKDFDKF